MTLSERLAIVQQAHKDGLIEMKPRDIKAIERWSAQAEAVALRPLAASTFTRER